MTSRFEYQGFLVPLFSFDGKCFQALIYRAIVPIRTSSIRPSSHLSLAAGSFRPFLDDCRSLDVPSGSSSITSVARCEGYRGKSFGTCVIGLCRQIEAREILFDSFFPSFCKQNTNGARKQTHNGRDRNNKGCSCVVQICTERQNKSNADSYTTPKSIGSEPSQKGPLEELVPTGRKRLGWK